MNAVVEKQQLQFRTIMYIGSKPRKYDSPNQQPDRVWPGTGTTVADIPVTQAAKLTSHKDEFIDVSGWTDEQIRDRAQQALADCADKKRKAHAIGRETARAGGILLEYATDEQIQDELERRRQRANLAQQTVRPVKEPTPAERNLNELTERDRKDETFLKARVAEALEAIMAKNDPSLLDEEGLPTRSVMEEELGFPLTDDDYAMALGT